MLFQRRDRTSLRERLRVWLWPRVSWRRSAAYYGKRTLRISGTPHAIAAGTAAGTFASFTPFMGFHILIALAVAWSLRGNLVAAAIGTAIGNPLTFPFIWAATYNVGAAVLHGSAEAVPARLDGDDLAGRSFRDLLPLIQPMVVGSLPLGFAAGLIVYVLAFKAVAAYQRQRRDRLAIRREAGETNVRSDAESES